MTALSSNSYFTSELMCATTFQKCSPRKETKLQSLLRAHAKFLSWLSLSFLCNDLVCRNKETCTTGAQEIGQKIHFLLTPLLAADIINHTHIQRIRRLDGELGHITALVVPTMGTDTITVCFWTVQLSLMTLVLYGRRSVFLCAFCASVCV